MPVRVRDLAQVAIGKELRTGAATQNGDETVLGTAMMLMGENSRTVARALAVKLDEINRSLPEGVTATAVYDRTQLVDKTIATVQKNLLEGALLFAILWWVRTRYKNAPNGLLTGLFFALYAGFRIFGEQFREPDAALVGSLTRGQFFSLFMFVFAALFLLHAWRGRKMNKG